MARTSKKPENIFVALLRGVNVGGNNMISMTALKTSFERRGFRNVSTYINSGNIIFKSKQGDPRKLETEIEKLISEEHQLNCRVVVRSLGEMANLVENLPARWDTDRNWKYNVIFLRHTIDSESVLKELLPQPEIEEVVYHPGTLLWSAQTSSISRTKMHKLSSQNIFREMTVRNTNTTRKLYKLMQKIAPS